MKKWKILKSKVIFKHPWIILVEDDVATTKGLRKKYLRFKHRGDAATIICQRKDGKILLSKEYSHPPREWLYQFPGGVVPIGENPEKGGN
jgi:hypothetical protein